MTVAKPELADRAAVYRYLRALVVWGSSADALAEARRIEAGTDDPSMALQALTYQIVACVNLRRNQECTELLSRAFAAVDAHWDPAVAGQLHILAGWLALQRGACERTIRHLVHAQRALGLVDPHSLEFKDSFHDLALTYSYGGLHDQALAALQQVRRGAAMGDEPYDCPTPEVPLRYALARDHRGDTAGCVRVLSDLIAEAAHRRSTGERPTAPADRGYYAYAAVRLAALGEPADLDADLLLSTIGDSPEEEEIKALAPVCQALAAGDGEKALILLAEFDGHEHTFGAAEPHRLASLAHAARGDLAAALAAERQMIRTVCDRQDRYSELFVEGVAARIDHEHLRHAAARFVDAARTDALTGLPNLRHLHRYLAALVVRGVDAMLAVVDLNGFKAVNDTHGHSAGDLVLARAAAIMARMVRRDDFVARYGGDEFVLVLPEASEAQAAEISDRLLAAIAEEDWAVIVPGTAVTASIGWGHLDRTGAQEGLAAADRAMYLMKRAVRGPLER